MLGSGETAALFWLGIPAGALAFGVACWLLMRLARSVGRLFKPPRR